MLLEEARGIRWGYVVDMGFDRSPRSSPSAHQGRAIFRAITCAPSQRGGTGADIGERKDLR